MSLRKTIFWAHLAVGVTGAVVILMLAVTGVILTYEAQLNRWALRDYRAEPPAPGVVPLGLDELMARVVDGRQPAGLVTSVALQRDPREPAVVELGDGDTVHVDRFTGEALGDGNTRMQRFLQGVLYWHRWFALDGEQRIVGRTIVAVANLGFLFLLVSGIYLWWPSSRSRTAWRNALWFRTGLRGRTRDFNWHNVIGFWSAVPLAIIVFSGAMISYQWAADLVHRLAGDTPPFQQSPRPWGVGRTGRPGTHAGPGDPSGRVAGARREGRRRDARMAHPHDRPSRVDSPARRRRGRPGKPAASRRSARTFCSTGQPASWSGAPAIRRSPAASRSAAGCGSRTPARCTA